LSRGYIVPIGGAEDKVREPAILRKFAKLCGGKHARIAIVPTASQERDTGRRYEEVFREVGVRAAFSLPFDSRADCEREDWIAKLEEADGVFFTGGNQLRLSTHLGGTKVAHVLRHRHAEGVHVAGTSAGAAFLSEHMIAFGEEGATPRTDMVTLAPGLGLSNRVIVDQHFRQRDRLGRLLTALSFNPYAIGIGLDEDTAAFIAPDDTLEVAGTGGITIVDPNDIEFDGMDTAKKHDPVCLINVRLHILVQGGRFDLTTRTARAAEAGTERH
jgi:cyanophycinase